jgi:hypothetical protein
VDEGSERSNEERYVQDEDQGVRRQKRKKGVMD